MIPSNAGPRVGILESGCKTILASVVVIALLLSTMIGATYSWLSDSDTSDLEVSTGTVDYSMDVQFEYEPSMATPSKMTVTYKNSGTLPIKINAKFWVEMFEVAPDRFGNGGYYYFNENNELIKSSNHSSIENNANCFSARIITGNTDNISSYEFNVSETIRGALTIDGRSADATRWQTDPLILDIDCRNTCTVHYELSFSNGNYPYDTSCDIPIQFYTIGVQSDYDGWSNDMANTINEKSVNLTLSDFESSDEISGSCSDFVSTAGGFPESDVVDPAFYKSGKEAEIRSTICMQSKIGMEFGRIGDAPKAVAL